MVKFVTRQRNPKDSDSAAGRLVWVRRKNGSWWPGQIMDASESCLDEAKLNGVPIKLLGRDDVNVEWYNLEVAKEVKAFRCGDLNSCIEKAKALLQSKKKLKLSPRDNAIILALELESSFCEANNMVKRKRAQNHSEHDDMDVGSYRLVTDSVCMAYFKKKRSKVVFEEIMKEENSIDLITSIIQSDKLVSVPIIYDEPSSLCKSSYSDENVSVFDSSKLKDYDSSSMPELLGYDSSDNLFDVLLIKEDELSDGFPSRAFKVAYFPESDLPKWQSKRKRNPRQKRRNREGQLDRYEFLEPLIKPHTSPIVYYDVHIEVDESRCAKNVPNISLKSILNRKPVSGPSISVEVLEDGACDFLLNTFMDGDYELMERRTRTVKTRTSACIPIKVVFSRIHDALMS